jgi:membrane-bound lytic murein transglycosylase D
MPVRASTLVAAVFAALLLAPGAGLAMGVATFALAPADSDHVTLATPLEAARAAYEAAWAQRHAGDPTSSIHTAETALIDVDAALSGNPDATTLRSLTEIRSKLDGLRDAARHELVTVGPPVEPGNEADEVVLNAPAVDAIQPQFNADVYRWIEFFSGAGRSTFERWLKRSGRYMDLFRAVLQKEGLPPDLVHLVFVESGFNINARSVSAAVGPWQFLRGTARYFGLTVDQWVDERKDPEKATVAAARYLKHLYSIFGDWPLALASYNAGEGTVLRAIKAQGSTNYWDLRLPKQTEDYVPQFMAALAISRDPVKYGFDSVELDDPMAFDEIALKGAVDLRTVARLADCSYEELRDLNPAVLRGAATSRSGVTTLRVPQGKGEILLKQLQDGAPLPAVNLMLKHKVKRGETLQAIAAQYSVGAREIARVNGIGRKRPLRRGMLLTVPASLHPARPELVEAGDPRASTAYVPVRKIGLPASLNGSSTADGRVNVTVHRGQTLQMIADQNGVSISDIVRWNHLKSTRVRRGTRLKIRTGDAVAAASDSTDATQIAALAPPRPRGSSRHIAAKQGVHGRPAHTVIRVRSGDTLQAIALRHGVSVAALKRANGVSGSHIRAGQRLKVPAS